MIEWQYKDGGVLTVQCIIGSSVTVEVPDFGLIVIVIYIIVINYNCSVIVIDF